MRGTIWMLAATAFAAPYPAAAATAEQPRANPVSWAPADATAGEPIDVVLTLSGAGDDPDDVAVVIRGTRGEHTFAAIPLGSGRYRTTITFPYGGGWDLWTSYRSRNGHRGEVPLGKSGIMMPGRPPNSERAAPGTRPAVIAGALALLLCLSGLALAVSRSASRGSPALPG